MGYYNWDWNKYDFKVDIKQDIDTYIDWDVDTDIDVNIDKDIDIKIDADVDVKDQGALVTAIVKDIDLKDGGYDPYPQPASAEGGDGDGDGDGDLDLDALVIADTTAIENVLSSSSLTVKTTNTFADLSSQALDMSATEFGKDYYPIFDSATFTEINLGIDNVVGEYTVITLDMQALVDG